MCNARAVAFTHSALPRVPRTHVAVARGTGTLCGAQPYGEPVSFDPRDATCPACTALAGIDDYCGCDVLHTAGEVARNLCERCGRAIE